MPPPFRKIILTGATGFLGSHLTAALLERGERLALLGRRSGDSGLKERIGGILAWFGRDSQSPFPETLETDFLSPRCGLGASRYRALCAETGAVIHCASDTAFSERNREQSFLANVQSLPALMDLAADAGAPLYYVSSAYSAGVADSLCLEELPAASAFHNVYEETKARAEREISAGCATRGVSCIIIRPSIVYGDSRTGRANRFNAIYHHVRSLACIRDIYLNDIRNHEGKKAAQQGIRLEDDGILHMPLRLASDRPGIINLIPIDYFVAATLAILEQREPGKIYHLTNPLSSSVSELARYCERYLGFKGLEIVCGERGGHEPSPAEELFERFVSPYRPYLSDTRIFDRTNTDRIPGGLLPPRFGYDIFRRCMDYAAGVNWGK
jgi:nucleoside-diphosphate-sugar epimerase